MGKTIAKLHRGFSTQCFASALNYLFHCFFVFFPPLSPGNKGREQRDGAAEKPEREAVKLVSVNGHDQCYMCVHREASLRGLFTQHDEDELEVVQDKLYSLQSLFDGWHFILVKDLVQNIKALLLWL